MTGAFGEVLDVELVSVEVWVSDGEGNPVVGLGPEEFTVLEDGREVPIRHFAEVRTPPGAALVGGGSVPAPVGTTVAETPAWLVVYLDELHLSTARREDLVETLGGLLRQGAVPPERVMILRQGQGLRAEATFGSSARDLQRAVARLADPMAAGAGRDVEKRLAIDRLQDLWQRVREEAFLARDPCDRFTTLAAREVEPYARQARERTATTLSHLEALASMLGAVPGVKTVVYLSDALETSPGSDLLRFVEALCPTGQREVTEAALGADLVRGLRLLARYAGANRVTIHALQPAGLATLSLRGAGQRAFAPTAVQSLQSSVQEVEREGLRSLASETGGRAVFDENDLSGAFERIGRDLGTYYTLAYEPPTPGDGGEHRIEVKVRGGGLVVRHRQGYRAPSAVERTRERLQAALYLGLVENVLGARLGVGEFPVPPLGERVSVPLHVLVPIERLAFLPSARVAVLAQAYDPSGKRVDEQEATVVVERPSETEGMVSLLTRMSLPAGGYIVVVAVRDETTSEESILSTELAVPGEPPR